MSRKCCTFPSPGRLSIMLLLTPSPPENSLIAIMTAGEVVVIVRMKSPRLTSTAFYNQAVPLHGRAFLQLSGRSCTCMHNEVAASHWDPLMYNTSVLPVVDRAGRYSRKRPR